VKVRLTRQGGLLGLSQSVEVDTADLDPDAARTIESRLAPSRVRRAAQSTPHPGAADGFVYEVAYDDQTLTVGDSTSDSELISTLESLVVNRPQPG
jgi:hypothetical protein